MTEYIVTIGFWLRAYDSRTIEAGSDAEAIERQKPLRPQRWSRSTFPSTSTPSGGKASSSLSTASRRIARRPWPRMSRSTTTASTARPPPDPHRTIQPPKPGLAPAFAFKETDMADFFTHFSCLLDVGTPENAARALDLYSQHEDAGERTCPPTASTFDPAGARQHDPLDPRRRDRRSRAGDPFRPALRGGFRPQRPLGFEYANTCSRPRLDAFGGGAHVLDLAPARPVVDRHQRLAGPDARTTSREARSAMSIPDHARANFQTLLRAAADGNLALMECIDAVTGEPRYVICAVGRDEGISCSHPSAISPTATRSTPTFHRPNPWPTHRPLIPPLLGLSERGGSRVNGRAVPASSDSRCVTREP